VGRRARDRFNSRLLPCRFALSAPSGLSHTCFVYSCNGHPSSLTGSLYRQSVTRGGSGCAIILSSDRFGFSSREHRFEAINILSFLQEELRAYERLQSPLRIRRKMSNGEFSAPQTASKRLYVGNLPYQAQSGDVEVIFVDAGFQMSVFEATIVT
jgi:hypothetical protein